MPTPKPIIGITLGKPYILVQETGLFIMKDKENSIFITPKTCITFTEHTPDGDITHTGIITSIDLSIDISDRGDGLIKCRVDADDSIKEIGITPATYGNNGNDWSTIKLCPKNRSNYNSKSGLDPLGEVPFRNAGGKRRRRTRQVRRRKNRRTRSRK
jgi:hypothetical protein